MQKTNISSAPIDTLLVTMGERLNALRVSQGIKNEELAKRSGVNRNTLTRLWKGNPVSTENLFKVLRALDSTDLVSALFSAPPLSPMEVLKSSKAAIQNKPVRKVYSQRPKADARSTGVPGVAGKRVIVTANKKKEVGKYQRNNTVSIGDASKEK
ncbi:MAG: helix-turn-helix domain-containing protein [Motiliproteus sp.]